MLISAVINSNFKVTTVILKEAAAALNLRIFDPDSIKSIRRGYDRPFLASANPVDFRPAINCSTRHFKINTDELKYHAIPAIDCSLSNFKINADKLRDHTIPAINCSLSSFKLQDDITETGHSVLTFFNW